MVHFSYQVDKIQRTSAEELHRLDWSTGYFLN